tara:strand:+ start:152 stop:709 length:558 start_codon:yes stop_codon:yes gene_type:complete
MQIVINHNKLNKIMKRDLLMSYLLFISLIINPGFYQNTFKKETIIEEKEVIKKEFLPYIKLDRKSTLPNDCKNPGNIRPGNKKLDSIAIGWTYTAHTNVKQRSKFLVFESPKKGFKALRCLLNQRLDWTIQRLMYSYAPPSDGNNTEKYVTKLCEKLECKRTDKVMSVGIEHLSKEIAIFEGFKI